MLPLCKSRDTVGSSIEHILTVFLRFMFTHQLFPQTKSHNFFVLLTLTPKEQQLTNQNKQESILGILHSNWSWKLKMKPGQITLPLMYGIGLTFLLMKRAEQSCQKSALTEITH